MRGAFHAFHQRCSKPHKKVCVANVFMSTKKSLNYLDNQNMPPVTTAEGILYEGNFFIVTIFDILN